MNALQASLQEPGAHRLSCCRRIQRRCVDKGDPGIQVDKKMSGHREFVPTKNAREDSDDTTDTEAHLFPCIKIVPGNIDLSIVAHNLYHRA
jgi:hypothetical protein